jgi:hypothetical protein
MIGPLSEVPNARKSTSYEGMNEYVESETATLRGATWSALDKNDFTDGVESQTPPQPDSPKTDCREL